MGTFVRSYYLHKQEDKLLAFQKLCKRVDAFGSTQYREYDPFGNPPIFSLVCYVRNPHVLESFVQDVVEQTDAILMFVNTLEEETRGTGYILDPFASNQRVSSWETDNYDEVEEDIRSEVNRYLHEDAKWREQIQPGEIYDYSNYS